MFTPLRAVSQRLLLGLLTAGSLLAARTPATAQWVQQDSNLPASGGITNLSIVDANTVWAAGFNYSQPRGTAYNGYTRTTNGGTTWTAGTIPAAASYALNNISAASSAVAWASFAGPSNSAGGYLYYTADGGTTWTPQLASAFPVASSGRQNGVLAFSATNAVVAGDPRTGLTGFEVYTTADAGTTWTAATSVPAANMNEIGSGGTLTTVAGTNPAARACWFGTSTGRVLRSTDSGKTWAAVATGLTQVTALAFTSATVGLALNANAASITNSIAYTQDGGATWQLRTPGGAGLVYPTSVSGVPGQPNTFVCAGYIPINPTRALSGSSYTTDGGTTWSILDTQVLHTAVAFLNGTTGWSGGVATASSTGTTGGMFKGSLPATALATTPALAAGSVSVYPNPATTAFTVQVPALAGVAQTEACLYNALGQQVARRAAPLTSLGAQLDFGTASLAPGIYTLRVQAGDANVTKQVSIR